MLEVLAPTSGTDYLRLALVCFRKKNKKGLLLMTENTSRFSVVLACVPLMLMAFTSPLPALHLQQVKAAAHTETVGRMF